MNNKSKKVTDKKLIFIKKLDNYKNEVWMAESTIEIINIARKIYEISLIEEPGKIVLANEIEFIDEKGKMLILKVLENDIIALENKDYSDLQNEKFAITSTIALLFGVFSRISTSDLLKILQT